MLTRTKLQELSTRTDLKKKKKEEFRIKGALWNAKQNKNTNNNSQIEEGKEKALKWSTEIGKEPYENHTEKNRALQNAKKNN